MTTVRPSTATLDPDRTERLRAFLTTEAAADLASAPGPVARARRPRRRLAVGVVAALALGGVAFAATAVVDGPGPTRSAPALALAIERSDGWTTIRLRDPDATPEAVIAELGAAGIDARVEVVDLTPDASGVVDLPIGAQIEVEDGDDPGTAHGGWLSTLGTSTVGIYSFDSVGAGGMAGLSVDVPALEGAPLPSFADDAEATFDSHARALEDAGVRIELGPSAPGGASIRDGAEVEVVVYAEA